MSDFTRRHLQNQTHFTHTKQIFTYFFRNLILFIVFAANKHKYIRKDTPQK